MAERKFSKAVGKPGMAAHVRETVSQVVKSSSAQVGAPSVNFKASFFGGIGEKVV